MSKATIKFIKDSYLKRLPQQSSELIGDQKVPVIAGQEFGIKWFKKEGDHVLFELESTIAGVFNWYAYASHIQINGLLVPSPPVITPGSKQLSDADYQRAANLLGVEVAAIKAVVKVEAAGRGFLADGRPKILFERHWFWKLTPLSVSKTRPDLSNSKAGGYLGGAREWDRLNAAINFDRAAALKSASWGLGQVMGFNHKVAGHDDIEEFVKAMYQSEGKQLDAMMAFIKNHPPMVSALRSHNWAAFAKRYNGPAYLRNQYDTKLAQAFSRSLA
jgi:hypothetical protein